MTKTRYALLTITVLLAGCAMDNDEIIAETAKCEKAGLAAQTLVSGFTYKVRHIQCVPKD